LTDAFEARHSPDDISYLKPYRDTLIAKGYLTTSGLINSLKTAPNDLKSLVEILVPKMVTIFKQTRRTGIAGDQATIKSKLLAILEKNPQFADEELILNACQRYVNTGIKDQYKFICELRYFVHKVGGGSKLITYCEEILELPNSILEQKEKPRYDY
jgi:hypothetical protein